MAKIIKSNGEVIENIIPKNRKYFSLKEMQTIVNGLIEIIYLNDREIMIVNEEGKLNNLAINEEATKIWMNAYPYTFDVIVGDVLVCDSKQVR